MFSLDRLKADLSTLFNCLKGGCSQVDLGASPKLLAREEMVSPSYVPGEAQEKNPPRKGE